MGPFTTENFRRAFVDLVVVLSFVGLLTCCYAGYVLTVTVGRTSAMWEMVQQQVQQQQQQLKAQAQTQPAAPPAKTE